MKQHWIYFLVSGDIVEYVGCTTQPKMRRSKWKRVHPDLLFKIVREVPANQALKEERKIMLDYWAKGQARLNRNRPERVRELGHKGGLARGACKIRPLASEKARAMANTRWSKYRNSTDLTESVFSVKVNT